MSLQQPYLQMELINIWEKVNEEFLASNNPGVDPDELDQLEVNGNIIEGDNQDYLDIAINLLVFL